MAPPALWLAVLAGAVATDAAAGAPPPDWRREVVYQIYPRSFADGDGDGIGDLRGILAHVDYLQELGVDVVWLCPVNRTTNFDNGYDVSDYLDIDPTFGTLADWMALRDALHQRGIKIMMDLVLNHSSDQHPWFQQEARFRALLRQLADPGLLPPGAAGLQQLATLIDQHIAASTGASIAPAHAAADSSPPAEMQAAQAALEAFVRGGQAASERGYWPLHTQLHRLRRALLGNPAERAEARGSHDDFYLWRARPNNWTSIFSGSAWHLLPDTGAHYLALFSMHQPDLNWRNPRVRAAMADIVKTWVARGVDGFRLDSVGFIGKDARLPNAAAGDHARVGRGMRHFVNRPEVHRWLHELAAVALPGRQLRTVGEISFSPVEEALLYTGAKRRELTEVFLFDHMYVDMGRDKWDPRPFRLPVFKRVLDHQQRVLHGRGWAANYLENHDQLRAVSRFGDDGVHRVESAKMLATLLFTLEGTPYVYQGQEIGMTNGSFTHIEEVDDIEARNFYFTAVAAGEPATQVMRHVAARNRDNVRTVMQWSDAANAGFSAHAPWIRVGNNYPTVNVAQARSDPGSILAYYRQLIQLRKRLPIFSGGEFEDLLPQHPHLYIFRRTSAASGILVLLNFSGRRQALPPAVVESAGRARRRIIGNYPSAARGGAGESLAPWEARVLELDPGAP